MAPAELAEYLTGRPRPAVGDVVQALPNGFVNVGAGSDIEQLLIGFRFLHDSLGLVVDGQQHGPLGLLDLLEKLARFAPKICQRLDILREVEHGEYFSQYRT